VPPRPTPDPATVAAVTVAILAVSTSGPIVAYAAAPALAIAFWRNAMAVAVLTPAALLRRRSELVALARPGRRRTGLFCVLAGLALGVHFATWVPSIKLTSVGMAIALVATQPVWQGLIAVGQGQLLPRLTWLGIGIAVLGVVLATGADVAGSGSALLGDGLALAGGLAAAVYSALGERARVTTSTLSYTAICYLICALALLVACLVGGARLGGYPGTAWLALVAITVGPQLLGHSLLNFALRRVRATTLAVLGLLEVPGAIVLGWLWLGQVPRRQAWPGLVLLVVGVGVVVLASRRARSPGPAPVADPQASVLLP
jgi:drug/metabolite transporter (DMT)-like permease